MLIIFFITLFLYLFLVGSCMDYVDYDFFARLIVGKTFFQTGDILKYDFLSDMPEKKEQFEADVVTGALAFAVGSLPSYLEHSGTISVAITTLIGLGVCGGIVLLRNQPYLSRRKPDFGDLEELELSIYDAEERLKGIDFGTDYLQTRSAHMKEAITKIRTQISPVKQKTL